MNDIELGRNISDTRTILDHLAVCDAAFIPRLSDRVELPVYAEKLATRAERFEAWLDDELVGLVAAYCNAPDRQTAFVTSVSVLPQSQGRGLASSLMERCISHTRGLGFRYLQLEVGVDNESAMAVYRKQAFVMVSESDGMAVMTLEL